MFGLGHVSRCIVRNYLVCLLDALASRSSIAAHPSDEPRGSSRRTTTVTVDTWTEPVRSDDDHRLVPCPEDDARERLTSYSPTDGASYFVDVERDAHTGDWRPVLLPRMPMHHASRLVFENLADLELPADLSRIRFLSTQRSHHIERVPGEERWRAEYVMHVDLVCLPRD